MKEAKSTSRETHSFAQVLSIIRTHRAGALASVNIEHLLSRWEIGCHLSAKIKQEGWGQATIDRLVDYIHANAPEERGYGRRNLYNMVAVYEAFTASDFEELLERYGNRIVQTPSAQFVQMPFGQFISLPPYALSRTMSPALVAEYKRVMIPREVLQETFDRYLASPAPTPKDPRP